MISRITEISDLWTHSFLEGSGTPRYYCSRNNIAHKSKSKMYVQIYNTADSGVQATQLVIFTF